MGKWMPKRPLCCHDYWEANAHHISGLHQCWCASTKPNRTFRNIQWALSPLILVLACLESITTIDFRFVSGSVSQTVHKSPIRCGSRSKQINKAFFNKILRDAVWHRAPFEQCGWWCNSVPCFPHMSPPIKFKSSVWSTVVPPSQPSLIILTFMALIIF